MKSAEVFISNLFFLPQILGRTGKVLEVDGTGDLLVLVEGDKWMLNPAAATYVTDPEPVDSPTVDSEDPLGIVSIRLFSTVDHCRGNCH